MIHELNSVIRLRKKILKGKNLSKELEVCKVTLDDYVTYRLPESANSDFWVFGRVYLRLLKSLFSAHHGSVLVDENSDTAILGPAQTKKKAILDHLEAQQVSPPKYYFVKENLRPRVSFLTKFVVLFRITAYAKYLFIGTWDKKSRQRKALSILQVFETASLLHLVKEHNISKVYDFTGFHIDSNFISHLLIEQGITVVKAPSPGPLKTHYQHLITSTICYSSPYHEAELKQFADTMIVTEKIKWKPQMSHLYYPFYRDNQIQSTNEKTVAFYSHGEWIRRELDHSDVGTGTLESEEFILECLSNYLKVHTDIVLTIYPHPIEKREENLKKTQNYYSDKLQGIAFKLAEKDCKTSLSFHLDNVAIVAASTMIYERLFCGFKVLIGSKKSNFLENSSIRNIECSNVFEFEEKLYSYLASDVKQYFRENDLLGFHHSTF